MLLRYLIEIVWHTTNRQKSRLSWEYTVWLTHLSTDFFTSSFRSALPTSSRSSSCALRLSCPANWLVMSQPVTVWNASRLARAFGSNPLELVYTCVSVVYQQLPISLGLDLKIIIVWHQKGYGVCGATVNKHVLITMPSSILYIICNNKRVSASS